MSREEEEVEGEDERKEAAIASTPSLQPGFKPTRVSQEQVFKLQELHKRRLKIKSKLQKNSEDGSGTSRSHGKGLKHSDGKDTARKIEDRSVANLKKHLDIVNSPQQLDNLAVDKAPKKRQKLHWGLDTKERWERKANM
ncbi:uncharacterized protein LOC110608476 isoform X2 [Manihot esculenta]|uniref:Uncharacterized protein n=1 Tax=Manihot esculenta TaxID=3983 RepID=A0A2C9WE74_MANES|nr:uncharacterized protein LOC110608476 isoform X2 [Manihot esculenta]OAY57095.1 hypothetical protein MANES_02G070000v8 [Manihot esculenta]